MPRVPVAPLLDATEANRYGFDWPPAYHPVGLSIPSPSGGAHVQVTRVSSIDRGKKGVWRVLSIKSEHEELHAYISPTGRMRVFRQGQGELVKKV